MASPLSAAAGDVPIFVLCGGLGTRFREETELRPKPMITIGPYPILLHIMHWYAAFGFRRFVLCMGYKHEAIRDYFLHYYSRGHDATVELGTNQVTYHAHQPAVDWQVTLADTGPLTMTGARVARAASRYLGSAEHFGVTYGDGLTDLDLAKEWAFHRRHGTLATVAAVNPPSRFGELLVPDGADVASGFSEKPDLHHTWINGGYFFFSRQFLRYLSTDEDCVLEQAPLVQLAADRQLAVYRHRGFWGCMDTQRDRDALAQLWDSGRAPWRTEQLAHAQGAGA